MWEGSDAALLEAMLEFYPVIPPEPILDATFNAGRFWKGSTRKVVSMDNDPRYGTDFVCDNREMPGVEDDSFPVVVYQAVAKVPRVQTRRAAPPGRGAGRVLPPRERRWGESRKRFDAPARGKSAPHPRIGVDSGSLPGAVRMRGTFSTGCYDPPHLGPQGRDKSQKRFDVDFGATVECGKEHDWNPSYLYPPFLQQARRVLKPD